MQIYFKNKKDCKTYDGLFKLYERMVSLAYVQSIFETIHTYNTPATTLSSILDYSSRYYLQEIELRS